MLLPRSWLSAWAALGALGLAACLSGSVGCRPAVETTSEATSLPPVQRDPMVDATDADCWPSWRGPNGSGVALEGSPAIRFSATEGLRWRVDVPGEGNSSPVVWGDFVLLTSALFATDPPTVAILAFRRSDGLPLWQVEVGQTSEPTHVKNGHASATVATDGERIFAFFGSTGLVCCDFSGQIVWQRDLGHLSHRYGTAASPVLYRNTVIQLCDSEQDSYIAGFDKRTGEPVWRTPRPSNGCWSTPVLIHLSVDGRPRTELVVNGTEDPDGGDGMVIAYDPNSGRALWRVRGTTTLVVPTPVLGNGWIYCPSGRNGPIMAIRPGGSGDVTATHVVWKTHRRGPYIPSGVFYRNRLYVPRDLNGITCYNAGNGQEIWTGPLRGPFTSSLVAADGRLYAANERGTVYVFRAADSFELLAENELDERCLATPAIASGELFIRTEDHLYCFPPGT